MIQHLALVLALNPFQGGWGNCTWSAWQLAYEATGIELPNLGNAGDWYKNAAAKGYTVSQTPVANSIGVWSNHVVFVTEVNGNNVYIKEGNYLGKYNEGWINGTSTRHGQSFIGYIYLEEQIEYAQVEEIQEEEIILQYDHQMPEILKTDEVMEVDNMEPQIEIFG